jgi:hypothetical protein
MKKTFFIAGLIIAGTVLVQAQVTSSTSATLQTSSLPEAKLGVTQSWSIPLLQGSGALMSGNNLRASITADITPIDTNLGADLQLTPIAFLQFGLGGKAGSGWNINLFGSDLYGIGTHHSRDSEGKRIIDGKAFGGLYWNAHTSVVFQFDLAAVLPGEWNHVVFRTAHEINYKGFTVAQDGESWVYENDDAENQNGFNYYASILLGYQMPLFINTVGLMAEVNQYLYNPSGDDAWGDSMWRWTFSILGNFTITKEFSAAVISQFSLARNYNDEKLYYRERTLNKDNPLRLEFFRVALILSYTLF